MGRSVEVIDGRIVSRRVGSVDWQDAMESFSIYASVVEDTGANELFMDMAEAELLIPYTDAGALAKMFSREAPANLAIAMVKPVKRKGAQAIEAFVEALSDDGHHVVTVRDEDEADAFFEALQQRDENQAGRKRGGLLGWFDNLFAPTVR